MQQTTGMSGSRAASSAAGFDYGRLIASRRRRIKEEAEAIRQILGRTSTNVVQIGLRLQLVRSDVGRENFQEWLQAEFQWSQSVASNYMRAATVFRDIDCLDRFQPSAMYVLSRKKVPAAARREAVKRAESGEPISKRTAQAIVANYVDGGSSAELRDQLHQVRHYVRRVSRKLRREHVRQFVEELLRLARELETALEDPPRESEPKRVRGRNPQRTRQMETAPRIS